MAIYIIIGMSLLVVGIVIGFYIRLDKAAKQIMHLQLSLAKLQRDYLISEIEKEELKEKSNAQKNPKG